MMQFLRRVNTAGLRRKRYERIASILDMKPTDRILDVGCGPGGRSVALYNSTNEIVGIDLLDEEDVSVEQANFRYVKLDASDLHELGDDSFDIAISVGMLEHIRPRERLRAAIGETQRVALLLRRPSQIRVPRTALLPASVRGLARLAQVVPD
jgi:cyclopropane fatty-acyl-phospholipid synthase-like methyltransferase